MKRLLAILALGALAAGCASDRGGTYDDSAYWENTMRATGSNIETNGPGMHTPTRTGLPGPGTTGTTSLPDTHEWRHGLRP